MLLIEIMTCSAMISQCLFCWSMALAPRSFSYSQTSTTSTNQKIRRPCQRLLMPGMHSNGQSKPCKGSQSWVWRYGSCLAQAWRLFGSRYVCPLPFVWLHSCDHCFTERRARRCISFMTIQALGMLALGQWDSHNAIGCIYAYAAMLGCAVLA